MPGTLNLIADEVFAGIPIGHLQSLQDDFARRFNAAAIIIDLDGSCITNPSNFSEVCRLVGRTEKGKEACYLSNLERSQRSSESNGPVYHMCQSCGFLDGAVPMVYRGRRVGYWLVGQCNALGVSRDDIALHAQIIGADIDQVLAAYDSMPPVSVEYFEDLLDALNELICGLLD